MRYSCLRALFCGWAFYTGVFSSSGAELARSVAEHTWKPMADWYRPDLRAPKLAPRSVEQSELRLRVGDDPRWAAPDWDDDTWEVIERNRVPLDAGIFWLRVRVRTTGGEGRIPAFVIVGDAGAMDFFWDGRLMRSAGIPGISRKAEIVGVNDMMFELPPNSTAPGEHVVALRMSTYRVAKVGAGFAQLLLWTVPPERYRALDANLRMLPAMGAGAMMTIALAVFVMWLFADRRLILLLFSALCLSAACLVVVAAAPSTWVFPGSWLYLQSAARLGLVVVVASLLVTVTMIQFYPSLSRAWLALPFTVGAAIVSFFLPAGALPVMAGLWRSAFIAVLALTGFAVWRRREGSWFVIAGIAVTFALFERDPKHFDNTRFLLGFLPILVGLIAAIALRVRNERLQARDTKLTAARLEIELLKKSLQPHFLMNTLTALSQVLEEKPAAAVRLINDLASEFRSLARFSGEKQVSIGEELALCRAHLGVMSARTDLTWSLEAEGVDVNASVPPALFLTLIENGFSHQRARRDATVFTLRSEALGNGVRYTFLSPGAVTPQPNPARGGTGLRYVRARLDESFHGGWNLSQRPVPGGWETVIELRRPRRNGAHP